MGLLTLGGLTSSKQLIVSDWFRVPSATMAAATAEYAADKAAYDDHGTPIPPMSGIIPLMILGVPEPKVRKLSFLAKPVGTFPTQKFKNYTTDPVCDWTESFADVPSFTATDPQWDFAEGEDDDEPSYIGIDCRGTFPAIAYNIQMGTSGTFGGNWTNEVELTCSASEYTSYTVTGGTGSCVSPPATKPNGHPVPFNDITFDHTYASGAQFVLGCRKERFRNLPLAPLRTTEGRIVTPDAWHHLIWSPDFRSPCITEGIIYEGSSPPVDSEGSRTTSACRMFMALDDVNLTGKNMSVFWPGGYSDPNAILSVNAFKQAADVTIPIEDETFDDDFGNNVTNTYTGFTKPTCAYTPEAIPLGHPLGMPATSLWESKIRVVERGPFQLFTGVSLDTSVEENRRLFVKANGTPAAKNAAEAALRTAPKLRLMKAKDWKTGRNTGSAGDLTPTGTISNYDTGPSLGG